MHFRQNWTKCDECFLPPAVFQVPRTHNVFLRSKRANNFLVEEIFQGNLERECHEELCNLEEAREYFEDDKMTVGLSETLSYVVFILKPVKCLQKNMTWFCFCFLQRKFSGVATVSFLFSILKLYEKTRSSFHPSAISALCFWTDGNKCNPNPCQHGGNCTSIGSTFHCACVPPHHGRTCEHGPRRGSTASRTIRPESVPLSFSPTGKLAPPPYRGSAFEAKTCAQSS